MYVNTMHHLRTNRSYEHITSKIEKPLDWKPQCRIAQSSPRACSRDTSSTLNNYMGKK